MKITTVFGRLGAIALMGLAVGLVGCQSDRSMGQKWNDQGVARHVNKNLADDPTFKYTDVKPVVYGGTVQLVGFVETPEQRLRAAEIASRTKGARQVVNHIMLKSVAPGPVAIRDPLMQNTSMMLMETNAPVPQLRNLPTPQPAVAQPAPGNSAVTPTSEETTPTPNK